MPERQVSVWVLALPSLQAVPSGASGFEHTPVDGLQVPATWHWSLAVQVTGLLPVQTPDRQESVWVQALPSLQAVPSGASGFEHAPVDGLQVPATWHWSLAVQATGLLPVLSTDRAASELVPLSPPVQVPPSGASGLEHAPVEGLQVPATWHWSLAVQMTGLPPVQTPDWQVS